MTGETAAEQAPTATSRHRTKEEKQTDHIDRIKRTLTACLIGIIVGVASFYISGATESDVGLLAFMLMLAGVIVQRHIFMLGKFYRTPLGFKDWFYQGFMTFALWFMTWTILMTSMPK